jgi:hypothetical protein
MKLGPRWIRRIFSLLLAAVMAGSALGLPSVWQGGAEEGFFPAAHALAAEADARDFTEAGRQAEALRELGLFLGTGSGFELERTPNRMEALVMLVRLLGKEAEALSGEWSDPFSDVPDWGAPYVGYAYEHGLTNGVADTLFGPQEQSNADQYLTFVLRALGYSDRNGQDFTWDEPDALARSAGILTDAVRTDEFLRADVVLVSYAALFAEQKGGGAALSWLLYQSGAFTEEAFENATGAGLTEGRTAAYGTEAYPSPLRPARSLWKNFLRPSPACPRPLR